MAAKATTAQIRKIHVLAKERGMDADLLHLYIDSMVKKDSLAKLSISEAIKVIDGLAGKKAGEEMATRKQQWKITEQVKKLGWTDEKGNVEEVRLNGFLKERFGIGHFKWLTKKAASDVIEALKAMLNRQEEN